MMSNEGRIPYNNPNREEGRKEKSVKTILRKTMTTWTRRVTLGAFITMNLALGAHAAEPPKGDYEVVYQGKVVDELQQPLKKAKVVLIGTALSATTDAAGMFEIQGTARRRDDVGAAPGVPAVGESPERFCPLEVTAGGCVARTILPDSARMTDMTVNLWRTPVEGKLVDLGQFAYNYRKGAKDNPSEAQALKPGDAMLRGFLWEEPLRSSRVEVEFAKGQTVPSEKELKVVTAGWNWDHTFDWSPLLARTTWHNNRTPHYSLVGTPTLTPQGATLLTFQHPEATSGIGVFYLGADRNVTMPTVRVYGQTTTSKKETVDIQWAAPQSVEIEWGFQERKSCGPLSGRIESYNGHVGKIEALEAENGLVTVGEHHWREVATTPTKRRGIRVTVFPTTGGPTHVTLWTSDYAFCFALADLTKGPILVPSTGFFATLADRGVAARQFQETLANKKVKVKTLRQQEREEIKDRSLSDVLAPGRPEGLPEVPKPPESFAPPMHIDVPDRVVKDLWRLSAWVIQDATVKINGPFTSEKDWWSRYKAMLDGKDPAPKTGQNLRLISIYGRNSGRFGHDHCAVENQFIPQTMDVMGMHDVAEGGVNLYLTAKGRPEPTKDYSTRCYYEKDGFLLLHGYDFRHHMGHGLVLETAVRHYRLTGDKAWLQSVAPVLKQGCEWVLHQQKLFGKQVGPRAWSYGLTPPAPLGDGDTSPSLDHFNTTWLYDGLKQTVDLLTENGVEGAEVLRKETEEFRQDLRTEGYRFAALFPVIGVRDGTYRRYIAETPYHRGYGRWESNCGGILFVSRGVFDVDEPIAQDILDLAQERYFVSAFHYAVMKEEHTWANLLDDNIPGFLRALYAFPIFSHDGYRIGTVRERTGEELGRGYTAVEAAFQMRVRRMLVIEIDKTLWLAKATPRAWLEQGKKIAIKNAPTFFGTVAYEIVSDVDNGKINATVEMPSRNAPKEVILRFRHPKAAPIKGVTVNGKPWTSYDKDKEAITLKDLTGTVTVTAQY
jgi:membrane protein implicated in regulation of membrane protease activity